MGPFSIGTFPDHLILLPMALVCGITFYYLLSRAAGALLGAARKCSVLSIGKGGSDWYEGCFCSEYFHLTLSTSVDNTVNWLILTFISTHFLLVPFRGSQNQRLHVLCSGVTFPFCSYDGKHKETEKIIKVKAGWIFKSDFKTLVWDRAVGVCASRCSIF